MIKLIRILTSKSIFICFYAFLFFSCSNDTKIVKTFVSNEKVPSETLKQAELTYTEKGKVKVKIIAQKIERFTKPSPTINFSQGLVVYFYNDSAMLTSTLTAQQAIIDDEKQQMIAEINVELINQKQEKLNTEKLIWDEKSNLIYTEKSVKITSKNEIIFGDGFESTPDFSTYKITNVRGNINIRDDKDTVN
ncbi:MAG: LPS export ABC transporter periplasmic protein LptC [Flavobacteriales bacterium]|nr:LPS export ABC transporter periplasmic protein LptC [Flavobacteriales bacterium]